MAIKLPEPIPYDYELDQVISYSEINTYRQCPLYHHMLYVERWSKPADEDSPLFKGTLWHEVMESHYGVLQAWQEENPRKSKYPEGMVDVCREAAYSHLAVGDAEQTENQALIQWMYDGYVEMYGLDPQWRILAVEYGLAARLQDPRTGDETPFVVKAKLDLIVQDRATGKIWVVDHKSGRNLPPYDDLDLDDQFGLYTLLMRELGVPVIGAIHSAARTQRNQADFPGYTGKSKPQLLDDRFRRSPMDRTDTELDSIAREAWAVASNMYPEVAGFEALPLYSAPKPNMFGYNRDFKEAYLLARKGSDLRTNLAVMGFEQNFERH